MNKSFSIDRLSFQEILASAFLVQQSKLDKNLISSVAELEELMAKDHFSVDTISDLPVEEPPKTPISEKDARISLQFQSTSAEMLETTSPVDTPPRGDSLTRSADSWISPLTVLVILPVLILGWMLGRVTWRSTQIRPPSVIPAAPQDRLDSQEGNDQNQVKPPPQAPPEKKNPAPPSDSLVIYQDGKVIFRTGRAPQSSRLGSGIVKAENSPVELPIARVAHQVTPEYPESAKRQHIEGPVVMEVTIGRGGEVQQLDVISGAPILADAASTAVRKWRFTLPRNRSSAQSVIRITVNFKLPR